MTTLHFPSPQFPGRPRLELPIPADWEPAPAAGATAGVVLAALRPRPADEFKANVIVSVDETFADHTVRTDLEGLERTAAHRRDGALGEPYVRNIDGVTFFGRDLSYVDATAGTLLTSTLFGFLRREVDGGLVRLTVTGTIGAAHHRADYTAIHDVIDALRVTPAEGTSPLVDDEI
jgi:hypothetical protein